MVALAARSDRESFDQETVVEESAAPRTVRDALAVRLAGLGLVEEGQAAQALPLVANRAADASTALAHEAGSFVRGSHHAHTLPPRVGRRVKGTKTER